MSKARSLFSVLVVSAMALGAAPLATTPLAAAQSALPLPPAPTTDQRLEAVLPSPSGDAFFDAPAVDADGLAAATPGEELARRDVTAMAAPIAGAPISRATQFQFRTTSADGSPTFGTATLLEAPGTEGASGHGIDGEPLLVYNAAIDSLGRKCTPGFAYANGDIAAGVSPIRRIIDAFPPVVADALRSGTSVLVPDHQGPSMAYADPFTAGHTILDSLRTGPMPAAGRLVFTGYSGGAIASLGAGKLATEYAPEVAERLEGVAVGGVPADFETLMTSMNSNLAVGLLGAATLGVARAHPEMLDLLTDEGVQIASAVKDSCMDEVSLAGATLADIDRIAAPGALESPTAEKIYDLARMSDRAIPAPLYIYHGRDEFWVPLGPVRALAAKQRDLGVPVTMREVPGEHFVATFTGYPEAKDWIHSALRG
ncbi:lipase family protein [Dietzia timorensis]|uniref:Lipase 4 n=1 Tax=Dietzia timorensis TaxID=499555 RepID=A0A173LLW6_9ACTN|nr:lipase family protein [Dietzia timorensis]ANI91742.1 Lipase 4 [Dietzia timorensis]